MYSSSPSLRKGTHVQEYKKKPCAQVPSIQKLRDGQIHTTLAPVPISCFLIGTHDIKIIMEQPYS